MKTVWLAFCLLSIATLCRADRDIVYAARYYAPPSIHRTSHFHIYRINPDGTGRTQLTFGTRDDDEPHWSADGRFVIYTESSLSSINDTLCKIDANGGGRRVLKTLAYNRNRDNLVVPGYRLENVAGDYDKIPNRHILINLKTGSRLTLPVPAHDDAYDNLWAMPGSDITYAANNHTSSGSDYFFYRLSLSTGTLDYLAEGQFLAWAPDGSRFCLAPRSSVTPYEKRKELYPVQYFGPLDARYRLVYFAPLYVRAAAGGPMKQITPRLSYVTGADWRKEK